MWLPQQVPYRVINDSTGNVKIASAHAAKEFAPEELSALVLRKLTDDAAKFLGDKASSCACTQHSCSRALIVHVMTSSSVERHMVSPSIRYADDLCWYDVCRSQRRSSRCRHTSTTHSARRPRTPAALQAWTYAASACSLLLPRVASSEMYAQAV